MAPEFRVSLAHISILIWLFLTESFVYATQSDIACLKSIKASLDDPFNYLSSWDFKNNTEEGFVCTFIGIQCWHAYDNSVLNIQLGGLGLGGKFPLGIASCLSLTGLNLSSNHIFGEIPKNFSKLLPYVTSLDLSSNRLSGEIPVDLANLTYLNFLKLDDNQLTGKIPPQIGLLERIKIFTVTNNRLTGPVPKFVHAHIGAASYANNSGLCGHPLPRC